MLSRAQSVALRQIGGRGHFGQVTKMAVISVAQARLLQFSSDWCSRHSHLQSVQNASAWLVSGARRHNHITPVLTTLRWLPVRKKVMFQTVVLMWLCLNGTAPCNLSELCVPVASASGRQHLRSVLTGLLHVPRARTGGQASLSTDCLYGTVFLLLYGDQRCHCVLLLLSNNILKAYLFHIWCADEQ